MQSKQMVGVAVKVVGIIDVVAPLLKLSVAAYAVGGDAVEKALPFFD